MRIVLMAMVLIPSLAATPATAQTAADAGIASDIPATPVKPLRRGHWADAADPAGRDTYAHEPGTGESGPASTKASNLDAATTSSAIAPHFPQPPGGLNAGWRNYLRDADRALASHNTGMAQQALEMAETRLLDRSTPMDSANQPDSRPAIQLVAQARRALAAGDLAGAHAAIGTALASPPQGDDTGEPAPGPGF